MNVSKICVGQEARELLISGAMKLVNIAAGTLGPKGKIVITSQQNEVPNITKDGYTAIKNINLNDPFENIGAQLMKYLAKKTMHEAEDGATRTLVIARELIIEGHKLISAGKDHTKLISGISKAVEAVIHHLKLQTRPVQNIKEGSVPGGGVAYLRAQSALETLELDDIQKLGADLIRKALESVTSQILTNAGKESQVILRKIKFESHGFGYNVDTDKYGDMVAWGIIDSTKTLTTALINATELSINLLAANSLIIEG